MDPNLTFAASLNKTAMAFPSLQTAPVDPRMAPAAAPPGSRFAARGGMSAPAIEGRKSTGASPNSPATVRNVVAQQHNVPPIMPDQIEAAAQAGPTAAQLAQFRKGTASDFDPNSWLDRNKMHALLSGQNTWADESAARRAGSGQRYAWQGALNKTAFASLESDELSKQAGALKAALGIGRGLWSAAAPALRAAQPQMQAGLQSMRLHGGRALTNLRHGMTRGLGQMRQGVNAGVANFKQTAAPQLQQLSQFGQAAAPYTAGAGLVAGGYMLGDQQSDAPGAGQAPPQAVQ